MNDNQLLNQPNNEIIRECPLCFSNNEKESASIYSRDSWIIKTCRKCSFDYLENVIPYSELIDNYAWSKTSEKETQFRLKRSPILKKISNSYSWFKQNVLHRDKGTALIHNLISSGRLIDVGCGAGVILKKLPENVIPFGIELVFRDYQLKESAAFSQGRLVVGRIEYVDACGMVGDDDCGGCCWLVGC